MKLSEFYFELPGRLIAQEPLPERDQSRMMVVRRDSRQWEHRKFNELPDILTRKDFLILNNTRVFPARIWGRRIGRKEHIEILLTRRIEEGTWLTLMRPARKAPVGQILEIGQLSARVVGVEQSGQRVLRFESPERFASALPGIGQTPLPPYIRRPAGSNLRLDRERYQTVFAKHDGSIAAPTAGLHFSKEILRRLQERGIGTCEILLHVGYGTFQPVRDEEIEKHCMEAEYYEITPEAAALIEERRSDGCRIIAVGTTSTRALEFVASQNSSTIRAGSGWCDLFIYPGFRFQALDGLLTNFHLPGSTLLMLVCAFAGKEFMLECYREAVSREYRFFSYGDCMLIL